MWWVITSTAREPVLINVASLPGFPLQGDEQQKHLVAKTLSLPQERTPHSCHHAGGSLGTRLTYYSGVNAQCYQPRA